MEILFNSPVSVKVASSSEGILQKRRAIYNIKVIIKNAAIDKEFIVELSDDQKPSFIFTVSLTRESYLLLQKEQRLEADFDQCIKIVVDFLKSLLPDDHSINEKNSVTNNSKILKKRDEENFIRISFLNSDKKLIVELMSKSTLKALTLLSLTMNAVTGNDLVEHLEKKMKVRVQALEHELIELNKISKGEKNDLENLIGRLKKENKNMEKDLEDIRKEKNELKEITNDKESELRSIQRNLDMLKAEREIDLAQIENMNEELDQYQSQLYEIEDILKDRDSENEELKTRLELTVRERDELLGENERLRKKYEQEKNDHSKAKEIITKLMNEHKKEQNCLLGLKKENEIFKNEHFKYIEEIENKRKKVAELEKLCNEQSSKIKLLQTRIEKVQEMGMGKIRKKP
uniref:SAS-6_N domain-containing protein n=1 Tax=Parastrongyloides trichosuri TaxID=131310 RepID=A0A0N4ZQP7_PARTI